MKTGLESAVSRLCDEIIRLQDENKELLEALTGLLDSFIHDGGGRNKSNMAKTAIFKHCPDVGKAASKAQEAIWHTEKGRRL